MARGGSIIRRKRARRKKASLVLLLILAVVFVLVKYFSVPLLSVIFVVLGVLVLGGVILDIVINGITKRFLITASAVIFALLLFFAVKFSWISLSNAIIFAISIPLVILSIGLIIYDIITRRVTDYINAHKKGSLTVLTALLVGAVFSVCYFITPICAFLGIKNIEIFTNVFKNSDLFDYYTAQLSITFISISVLSVLSDKSVNIYWANVSEDRLIKPTFSCFAAYTYYSIGATLGAGLGVVLNDGLIFAAFFLANILVMIVLTASMVDVYYGRDIKIKKLRKELTKDYYNGRRPNAKLDSDEYIPVYSTRYCEKILGIRQHLYNSYENNELAELKEIYELYACCPDCFFSKEGETAVKTIIETVDEKTLSLFVSSVLQELNLYLLKIEAEEIKNRVRPFYYFTNKKRKSDWEYSYVLDIDKPLWKALSDEQFIDMLKELMTCRSKMTERTLRDLLVCIKRRMAFIYNYQVFKKDDSNKEFVNLNKKIYVFESRMSSQNGTKKEKFKTFDYLADTKGLQEITLWRKGNNATSVFVDIKKIKEMFCEYAECQKDGAFETGSFEYLLKITEEILAINPKLEEELEDFPFHKVLK